MPTYLGFNTTDLDSRNVLSRPGSAGGVANLTNPVKPGKKFRLTDDALVTRDFLNALSIKRGDKVGNPSYGTKLWDFIFDPNTVDLRQEIESEIRRVASEDTRMNIGVIDVYHKDHGILVEMEISINPFNNVVQFGFFINTDDASISFV